MRWVKSQSCKNSTLIFGNSGGFILVLTLVLLVILSIMGGAAIIVRNTEVQIAANTEMLKANFYAVEAVTLEGAVALAKLPDGTLLDVAAFPDWLKSSKAVSVNLQNNNQWSSRFIFPEETHLNQGANSIVPPGYAAHTAGSGAKDRIQYAALDLGLCPGSSYSHGSRFEKCFSIYGLYDVKDGPEKAYPGQRLLNIGYKRVVYAQ